MIELTAQTFYEQTKRLGPVETRAAYAALTPAARAAIQRTSLQARAARRDRERAGLPLQCIHGYTSKGDTTTGYSHSESSTHPGQVVEVRLCCICGGEIRSEAFDD